MSGFSGAFISGKPVVEGSGAGPVHWLLFLLSPFIFSFSLACVYLGMRGVMKLGGFVATGGLAFGWIICAVTFITMGFIPLIFILRSFFRSLGKRTNSPNVMIHTESSGANAQLAWSTSLILQIALCGGGFWLGLQFFRAVS